MGLNALRNRHMYFRVDGKQSCDAQLIEKSKEKDETPLSFKKTIPRLETPETPRQACRY